MTAPLSQPAEQVRIQLSTRHADLELPERTGPILVSTNLKRYALSTLVNTLLNDSTATHKSIPLQFIINGQFLRASLSDFLNEHGVSAETTLSVEYVRAQLPPTYETSFQHDDWVGSVDVLSNASPAGRWSDHGIQPGQERILSGCYDGLLRVWNPSGEVIATSTLSQSNDTAKQHPQLIYAAKFISPTHIVSGGFGIPTRIWSYAEEPGPDPAAKGRITPLIDLQGHTAPLTPFDSIAIHAASSHILTCSADCTANLYSSSPTQPTTPAQQTNATPPAKKRRLSTTQPHLPTASPLATLKSHTRPLTAALFHPTTPQAAYTVSADRTLRTWDLATATCIATRTPAHDVPLSSLAALPRLGLLAVGTVDRRVCLVDPREDARRTALAALKGCAGEVTSLAAEPEAEGAAGSGYANGQAPDADADAEGHGQGSGRGTSGYGLLSASYDGIVRVWDVRNTAAPTYKITREGGRGNGGGGNKLFSLVWDAALGIVSAGEDGRVQVNRSPG